eukprot:365492-Chlamydomonas_euryale.AAC.6
MAPFPRAPPFTLELPPTSRSATTCATSPTPACCPPPSCDADYRRTVGLKYVKRGFQALFAVAPPLLALPLLVMGGAELLNLWKQGELHRLFAVARQTELTFDLVRACCGTDRELAAAAEPTGAPGRGGHSRRMRLAGRGMRVCARTLRKGRGSLLQWGKAFCGRSMSVASCSSH